LGKSLLDPCFDLPLSGLRPLLDEAYGLTRRYFRSSIYFYFPGMVHFDAPFYKSPSTPHFPGISITGRVCRLDCEHCRGRLLDGMIPARTLDGLFEACAEVKAAGGLGCLVTGGSLGDGSIPLMEFMPTLKRVKEKLGLRIVVHTGLVDENLAQALADAGIDAAMMDVIGSDETIRQVYRLSKNVGDYERSLALLGEYNVPTVPHVVVGIHYGQLKGERAALEMIARQSPAAVVVVALMPIDGTPMENVLPPSPVDVARVILAARFLMPWTPLLLGCARPRGALRSATDVLAIKAGVNGIAYPSEEAYKFAQKFGLRVKLHEECCSLLWRELVPACGST